MARSIGFLVGSLLGGILCGKLSHLVDVWVAGSLLVAAIGTAIAPWCRVLSLLGIMFCLDGLGKGVLASGIVFSICVTQQILMRGEVHEGWGGLHRDIGTL